MTERSRFWWNFYINWHEWCVGYVYDQRQGVHVVHFLPVVALAVGRYAVSGQRPPHA